MGHYSLYPILMVNVDNLTLIIVKLVYDVVSRSEVSGHKDSRLSSPVLGLHK